MVLGEIKSRIRGKVVDRFVSITHKIIPQTEEVYRVIFWYVILLEAEERGKSFKYNSLRPISG